MRSNPSRLPIVLVIVVLSLFATVDSVRAIAEEHQSIIGDQDLIRTTSSPAIRPELSSQTWNLFSFPVDKRPIVLPRASRVSRSHQPLFRVGLVGGDRFLAECLKWETDTVEFRLLNGKKVQIPVEVISRVENPPGEFSLINESFESEPTDDNRTKLAGLIDDTVAADGLRSLKLISPSMGYRLDLGSLSLGTARIEFSFQIQSIDASVGCGEWQFVSETGEGKTSGPIVRIEAGRRIRVVNRPHATDSDFQTLALSGGWHTFLAVVGPERTRLIVDDFLLATYPTENSSVRELRFRPASARSKNALWIDAIQVRRLVQEPTLGTVSDQSVGDDRITFDDGNELFGRLVSLTNSSVEFEAFERVTRLNWNRVSGLNRRQPSNSIQQTRRPEFGMVATIELQPFVDRPECEPEKWTVTIVRNDANALIADHWAIGEMAFEWSTIRRIVPQFFGRHVMADARQFHLGNSIRPDFHRHRTDGTEFQVAVSLTEIPQGEPYLSLNVAELEAAGPDAPPGSPFLRELRSGRLVTEVFVNERRIGDLNSLIRFKTSSQKPERIRKAIPRDALKVGTNTVRLVQKPLDSSGREFDDCEIGSIRLEFELTN